MSHDLEKSGMLDDPKLSRRMKVIRRQASFFRRIAPASFIYAFLSPWLLMFAKHSAYREVLENLTMLAGSVLIAPPMLFGWRVRRWIEHCGASEVPFLLDLRGFVSKGMHRKLDRQLVDLLPEMSETQRFEMNFARLNALNSIVQSRTNDLDLRRAAIQAMAVVGGKSSLEILRQLSVPDWQRASLPLVDQAIESANLLEERLEQWTKKSQLLRASQIEDAEELPHLVEEVHETDKLLRPVGEERKIQPTNG